MYLGDYLYKSKPIEFKKWTRKHYMIQWYTQNRTNTKQYKYDIEEHDEYLRWCLANPRGPRSNYNFTKVKKENIPNLTKSIKRIIILFD